MSTNQNCCPACGAQRSASAGRSLDCPACGTKYAFEEYFSGKNAYNIWCNITKSALNAYQKKQITQLRENSKLIVGPECIMFLNEVTGELTGFDRFGRCVTERNVLDCSVSSLCQIFLKTNGMVSVSGDTEGGRLRANGATGIRAVLAARRCAYLVNEQGRVECYGACSVRSELENWRDIRQIACGNNHVIGLNGDGTVVQTGGIAQSVAEWKKVKAIAAAANYTLGLHQDGTVSYAGPREEVRRDVEGWKDIAAIAADSQYAVGLTNDGNVLLAGTCKPYLDSGRSAAGQWKNVVCIGAGSSVIAAVTTDGELRLAGGFLRPDDVIGYFREYNPVKR